MRGFQLSKCRQPGVGQATTVRPFGPILQKRSRAPPLERPRMPVTQGPAAVSEPTTETTVPGAVPFIPRPAFGTAPARVRVASVYTVAPHALLLPRPSLKTCAPLFLLLVPMSPRATSAPSSRKLVPSFAPSQCAISPLFRTTPPRTRLTVTVARTPVANQAATASPSADPPVITGDTVTTSADPGRPP